MKERVWSGVFAVAALLDLVGCGHGGDATMPALEGLFRSPAGAEFAFQRDGTFASPGGITGTYTVEGKHLVLKLGGRSLEVERQSDDDLLIPAQLGKPEEHLYRIGSQAEAANASTGARQAKPSPAPAPSSDVKRADPPVPLDRYVALDPMDPLAIAFLGVAYASAPLTGEQKLSMLSKDGAGESDAFKRRELMAQQLPAMEARLDALRSEHHYRVDAADLIALERLRGLPYMRWSYTVSLGHYDTVRGGFPIACLDDGNVGANPVIAFDEPSKPARSCFLPVPDESTARRLEEALSHTPTLPVSGTLYFTVVGPSRRVANSVAAELTHAHLKVYDPGPRLNPPILGEFDIDVPQPLVR